MGSKSWDYVGLRNEDSSGLGVTWAFWTGSSGLRI